MRLRGRHYATGEAVDIVCVQGTIASVEPSGPETPDLNAGWIAPGFFDLQINGALGHGFSSPGLTTEAIKDIAGVCRRHGITGFCPTVITSSFEVLSHSFDTLRQACEADAGLAAALPAFHLEGPYISPEDGPRGAHPKEHVRRPDWQEFCRLQESAGGRIRLVTLAPEADGALSLIKKLTASGVVVAIGHTAATGRQIKAAISAGARLSTHLGNGAHALLPRHDNYIWEQLAADLLRASLICDGQHLPPAVVRSLVRGKTPSRIILTCDAGSLAGMPPGRYREWGQDFEVLAEGKIVLADTGFLGGSWVFTDSCIGHVIEDAGVLLSEAIDMATTRPRELLGLPPVRLGPGSAADLVLFDWQPGGRVTVTSTIVRGVHPPVA
jgi:N-acetylglucosamine-6-phosphate deacetylase